MYSGPNPKDINKSFSDHTYEKIVCLVTGELKKIIYEKYLNFHGYTKESYLLEFPGAPLCSRQRTDKFRKVANSPEGRKNRSDNMRKLNLCNDDFQEKRIQGCEDFRKSGKYEEYKQKASERAKKQHRETDIEDKVREYFRETYPGSEDQKNRSKRMLENNPNSMPGVVDKRVKTYIQNSKNGNHTRYKRKLYANSLLTYQSSYEEDFLNHCNEKGILECLENAPVLSDDAYPMRYYEPDFLLYGKYIIEIKSWYIEQLQETKTPGSTREKENLVKRSGYTWVYILDKDYSELDTLI